ncbi:YbaB/EbfC family nucleoid-associated protein [Botrimarina sp.]|uniref:YbaB/EbfC family nucleoid-associated protein n=1 Tax=Botrimarina sp. TaxID=2795802 RepID=UPI0032ED3DF7
MFKGLGNLANLGQIAQQAQQMSARVQEVQERLKHEKVTGAAGGGMVEVDMSGAQQVLAVRIDPGLVERGEREMLEDFVAGAVNDAAQKAKELHAEAMQELTGGMNLPGMDQMLSKFTGEQQ